MAGNSPDAAAVGSSMKLWIRISRRTSRVELLGAEPSLKKLMDLIRETVFPSHGLSEQTEFSLTLNGSELLPDSGQTLSFCGVVSGDLICVILPRYAAATSSSDSSSSSTSSNSSTSPNTTSSTQQNQQPSIQPSGSCVVPPTSGEPMLCSEAGEGQVPPSLELLHHSTQSMSPNDAIMVAGHPVAFGLAALPPELLLEILTLLDICSVAKLALVCRCFNAVTADSWLWRRLLRRDFTCPDPSTPTDTDWKEVYKHFKILMSPRRPHICTHPMDTHIPLQRIIVREHYRRPNLLRPRYDPIYPFSDRDRRLVTDGRRVRQTGGRSADVRRSFI